MYVFFKALPEGVKVLGVFYDTPSFHAARLLNHADVVWRVIPERIIWIKDRYEQEHTDRRADYGYALIKTSTDSMLLLSQALASGATNLENSDG